MYSVQVGACTTHVALHLSASHTNRGYFKYWALMYTFAHTCMCIWWPSSLEGTFDIQVHVHILYMYSMCTCTVHVHVHILYMYMYMYVFFITCTCTVHVHLHVCV